MRILWCAFVALLEAAEDGDGVFDVGLADVDDLETALEGGASFSMYLRYSLRVVAPMARRPPRASAGLSMLRGVHGAFGGAGADEGVELVDEEDDFAVRVFDLFEDGFEALFELAAKLGAGDHGGEVEGARRACLWRLSGTSPDDDAAGEAFDDGGFADAGLADEDGVVFGAAGEDLDDAADLLVAADDGVELAAAGELGEVFGVLFERLELALGGLVGDAGACRGRR